MRLFATCLVMALIGLTPLIADTTAESAIAAARQDAVSDTERHRSLWWGLGAFGFATLNPLFGGGYMIERAYRSGETEMPPFRFAEIYDVYGDDDVAIAVYQQEYSDSATRIKRNRNVVAAWIGAGAGTVAFMWWFLMLLDVMTVS